MGTRLITLIVAMIASLVVATTSYGYPNYWKVQAACIHQHESTDWHRVLDWLNQPSPDHGGYQIDVGTWQAYRPKSFPFDPADATPAQQTYVAWLIWKANGRRWGGNQWPNSSKACGVN